MGRLKNLDFLRGCAILLVLVNHVPFKETYQRLPQPFLYFEKIGWCGVDLFFVLSGFLISTLLMEEIKSKNKFDWKRYAIRRFFRIVPVFYVFILCNIILNIGIKNEYFDNKRLLSEVLFIQNYKAGVWPHTWSLAVEEHFYLFLPILLIVLAKLKAIRRLPFLIFTLIFCIVVLRTWNHLINGFELRKSFFSTHLRADSLMIGVLIGYFFVFEQNAFRRLFRMSKPMIVLAILLLLLCFSYPRESLFNNSIGFTLIGLSFGLILIASILLESKSEDFIMKKWICFIGMQSYSIYLWNSILYWFHDDEYTHMNSQTKAILILAYFILNITLGCLFGQTVESYFFRVRNRLFPTALISKQSRA